MIPIQGIKVNKLLPSNTGMTYTSVLKKLKKGISLFDRERRADNNEIERIAVASSKKHQFRREFDGLGEGIVEQIQSGSLLPDELMGWSTKSILALLLVAMIVKNKMRSQRKHRR